MTDSPVQYLALRVLIDVELRELETVTTALVQRDARKYAAIRRTCQSCGAPFDWPELLAGRKLTRTAKGDFDARELREPEDMVCACGAEPGVAFMFQRGVSALAGERRAIYRRCDAKLSGHCGLSPAQIGMFLRYVFRMAIVRSVVEPAPDAAALPKVIELVDVHRTFRLGQTDVAALRGATLSVHKGEFVGLVGASGAGKSTLLNIIGCIDRPTKGHVAIDGVDVSRLPETERAALRNRRLGFVFQAFNLLPVLDVFENVELPLLAQSLPKQERRERVLAAIEDVDLTRFIHHKPDQLSGGQRQRVAIARALVTAPALVIADEPTANLDSATGHHIVNLMAEMNEMRGVTFLFSTHDEKLIARVRRVVKIADGVVVPP